MSTTPADEDAKTERAVLAFVLNLHPTRLSRGELARARDLRGRLGGWIEAIAPGG